VYFEIAGTNIRDRKIDLTPNPSPENDQERGEMREQVISKKWIFPGFPSPVPGRMFGLGTYYTNVLETYYTL
jgi:hypothetical protein